MNSAKAVAHLKLKRLYTQRKNHAESIFYLLVLVALFIFFAVLRDELVRWAGEFCLRRNIVFTTRPVAALAAVLAALNLNTKLCDEFPPEARAFYKIMGFERPDFVLLELLTILFRGAAEALFITVFRYGLLFFWRAVFYFFEILISMLAGALALFRLNVLKGGLQTRRVKGLRLVNKMFFRHRHLSFLYGDFTAGRKVPDLWVDIILIILTIVFCVYFQINFTIGLYFVVWISAAVAADCYRYDANRIFLFQVLRMNKVQFLRYKLFDMFFMSEFFLAVSTVAALARGTVNLATAAFAFFALSVYGAVMQLGANLVCIRAFPRYAVAGSVLYALLSFIPFAPFFLTAFLFWKMKAKLRAEL
jgi:hypothetical protein